MVRDALFAAHGGIWRHPAQDETPSPLRTHGGKGEGQGGYAEGEDVFGKRKGGNMFAYSGYVV